MPLPQASQSFVLDLQPWNAGNYPLDLLQDLLCTHTLCAQIY